MDLIQNDKKDSIVLHASEFHALWNSTITQAQMTLARQCAIHTCRYNTNVVLETYELNR